MRILAIVACMMLASCGKLTSYNLKGSVGQTAYDDGNRSLYTGASADFHFDVK